jgi:hypothetical protein
LVVNRTISLQIGFAELNVEMKKFVDDPHRRSAAASARDRHLE